MNSHRLENVYFHSYGLVSDVLIVVFYFHSIRSIDTFYEIIVFLMVHFRSITVF